MRHPVWFINMIALADWQDPRSTLASLSFFSPRISAYLDETNVRGNADAQALVNVLDRLYRRFFNLDRLVSNGSEFIKAYRRVRGLANV